MTPEVSRIHLLLLLAAILQFVIGAPHTHIRRRSASLLGIEIPPDEDEFYKPPRGYELAAPGTILRYRPVPNAISMNNKTALNLKSSWQIQYRSQNSVGEPEASIVTVLVPHNPKPQHLFAYSYISDAAFNGCLPSVAFQIGNREDNSYNQLQLITLVRALYEGWYVSIADDIGPQAAFSTGLQAAYATLDSFRAIKKSGLITGISPDPIITLSGYSGGGFITAWTTEIQPSYAPDLKIAGVALGGIAPNATYTTVNPPNGWGMFTPMTFLGLSHDYRNLSKWLDENLVPEHAADFHKAEQQCFNANYMFDKQPIGMYFKRGQQSLLDPIPLSVLTNAAVLGLRGPPKAPWYLYSAVGDDASPIFLTDILVNTHCKNGANILYERNPMNITHRDAGYLGYSGAFSWIQDRHNGVPIETGCHTVPMTKNSWMGVFQSMNFQTWFAALFALWGVPIGSSWPTSG